MTSVAATLIILYCTLLIPYVTFINLSESSFAQTTNANQTSTGLKTQPNGITSCKLTESAAQGAEFKAGAPSRKERISPKDYMGNE